MSEPSIWNEGAERFMSFEHLSQKLALHPTLVNLIDCAPGNRLLDYGCGDGRILTLLSARWAVDAYDPSTEMRTLAQQRVGFRLRRIAATPAELDGEYDAIIMGMVLPVLKSEDEIKLALTDCVQRMHKDARLFISTTHPCFRTYEFSNCTTSFGRTQPFTYMQDGVAFEVNLKDPGTSGIVFTDYHWSLGFTVNALAAAGLTIVTMLEVPDEPFSDMRNSLVPMYLILECRRSS